jgi:hypothetical protein
VAVGYNSGSRNNGVAIGYRAYASSGSIAIGSEAGSFNNNSIVIGNFYWDRTSDTTQIILGPIEITFGTNTIIFKKDGKTFTMSLT